MRACSGIAACRVCHTSTCHLVLNQFLYRLHAGRSVNHPQMMHGAFLKMFVSNRRNMPALEA